MAHLLQLQGPQRHHGASVAPLQHMDAHLDKTRGACWFTKPAGPIRVEALEGHVLRPAGIVLGCAS